MKKLILLMAVCIIGIASAYSQDYQKYMDDGMSFFNSNDFVSAMQRFDLAYEFADSDSTESIAKEWKDKSIEKIKQDLADYKKSIGKAETAMKIVLNASDTWIKSGKTFTELAKFRGQSQLSKSSYFDAWYYYMMGKMSPDYTFDNEIESNIIKCKDSLNSIKKVALVIGNANYVETNLDKALTDAKDVTKALESMGFEVLTGFNLKSGEFDGLVKQFYAKGMNSDIALFFYTGFGYQSDYLLPVDTKTDAAGNLKSWFSLNYLMNEFPKNFRTKKIFILDMDRTSRDAFIPAVMAYRNSMVVFSAAPNNKAFNGVGRNSLFTEQFLKYLTMTNTSFQDVFKLTREATMKVSKDRQVPTIYDNIQNSIYLNSKVE